LLKSIDFTKFREDFDVFAGEVFKWWGPGVAGSDYGFVQSASLIFNCTPLSG
jgi:hypothetical protein